MENLVERKQKLFSIIDGYAAYLERQKSGDLIKRGKELLGQKKIIDRDRYHIALIGYTNRGKSTLLNAMLGNKKNFNISPVKVLSTTAAIVQYKDSKLHPDGEGKEGAIIHFNNGNSQVIGMAEIPKYVDQNDPGFVKSNTERIDHIEVYGNFPLIETRGVFVDTPGMGALYDQNYLAQNILDEVDVILCPIAADRPLDKGEREFLASLTEGKREKLMYVLTKVDDVEKDELPQTIAFVQEAANSISGGTPTVYHVAAKKVLDAYAAGKPDKEIERIKETCGMKALEDALDRILRTRSDADKRIRIVCEELEGCFINDKSRLSEMKENFSLKSHELEEKIKVSETTCKNIKSNFEKGIKKLKQEWEREVKRFINRLENKEAKITDRLTSEVERGNILTLIGSSAKLQRKIQSLLKMELETELLDLQSKLENIVDRISNELRSDVDNDIALYNSSFPRNSLKNEMGALVGGSVAAGGIFWGATTATAALAKIAAAAAGLGTRVGLIESIKLIFVGGSTATSAFGAAIASSVIPLLGGVAIAAVAYRIGTELVRGNKAKTIPNMVETQLRDAAKSIEDSSRNMLEYILKLFQDQLDTVLTEMQNELKIAKNESGALKETVNIKDIEQDKEDIEKLSENLKRFMTSIGA